MKLLARFKFSLWTLLWFAVLIGAGMGMYAKREPWRIAWEAKCSEPDRVKIIPDSKGEKSNTILIGWFPPYYDEPTLGVYRLDLRNGRFEVFAKSGSNVAISKFGTRLFGKNDQTAGQRTIPLLANTDGEIIPLQCRRTPFLQGYFSPNGNYVACYDQYSARIFSVSNGKMVLEWENLKTYGGFYASTPDHTEERTHLRFHPFKDRALVRVADDVVEEWDLRSKRKIRGWRNGELIPHNLSEIYPSNEIRTDGEICVVDYLENGYLLFRTWKGIADVGSSVLCVADDGKELWRYSSINYFYGGVGLFEANLILGMSGNEYFFVDLTTSKVIPNYGGFSGLFPDQKRYLSSQAYDHRLRIVDMRTSTTIGFMPFPIERSVGIPEITIIDNDHLLAFNRPGGIFSYFERTRPEYWWGWFYVPETYIAALAVGCLLASMLNSFRAKNKLAA